MSIGPFAVEWNDRFPHPGGCIVYVITINGKKLVYATDVELDGIFSENASAEQKALAEEYSEFIANADLLIADAQYTAEEYEHKTAGWGHGTIPTVLAVAHNHPVAGLGPVEAFLNGGKGRFATAAMSVVAVGRNVVHRFRGDGLDATNDAGR